MSTFSPGRRARVRERRRRRGQRRRAGAALRRDGTTRRRSSSRRTWTWCASVIPSSPYDPRAGRIHLVLDGDWVVCRRDDARCRQRDRSRGGAGGRRGPGDRARPARAALHRLGGAGPRRREEPRPLARLRTTAPQSGRDERQGDHDRLRGQLAHVHAAPARPRGGPGGSRRAGGRRVGSARRSLGRRHRPRTGQRDQGARPRPRSRVRGAPFRLASLEGGVSRNALPREARAVIALSDGDDGRFASGRGAELARSASSTPARTMRCQLSVDRRERRRGQRVHDVSRARPARRRSRAASSP